GVDALFLIDRIEIGERRAQIAHLVIAERARLGLQPQLGGKLAKPLGDAAHCVTRAARVSAATMPARNESGALICQRRSAVALRMWTIKVRSNITPPRGSG